MTLGRYPFLEWDDRSVINDSDPLITVGFKIEVNEFDYKAVNNAIYQENGVTIRTIPAIRALDGPVSFILEWNGLKFAFSSDTYPNKWWVEHTKGADLAIHQCFIATNDLVKLQN